MRPSAAAAARTICERPSRGQSSSPSPAQGSSGAYGARRCSWYFPNSDAVAGQWTTAPDDATALPTRLLRTEWCCGRAWPCAWPCACSGACGRPFASERASVCGPARTRPCGASNSTLVLRG
eukprot:6208136-Pleurochrysis_carterae.AAC.1